MLSFIHVFLCLIHVRSAIYLYCSPVLLCCHFNVIFNNAIKVGGLACHKTRFNPPFFSLKMSCTKSGKWPLLYHSSFVCVTFLRCVSVVSFVFSYIWVWIHITITCHGTFLSQIHVFGFDVILVILIGFCLMLSPLPCVLHFNVVSLFSSDIYAFPSVLVCCPDFVFCP